MNALLNAEQAVLGAVLLDPGQLDHLGWLAPDHFYRPVHQALFAALRQLRAAGHPVVSGGDEVPLSWVTDAVTEAGRSAPGMTMVYAHTLVSACPRPVNAPVYGRMVLEGAIHRTVTEHAVRLHQAARADAVRGGAEEALHSADVLSAVLGDLAHRWGSNPQPSPHPEPPDTTNGPPLARGGQTADDEQLLLAALVDRPDSLDEVVDWLRPGDFADPAHGHLYRCLGALHHRAEPIDQVTLLWEAQRRGLLADGTLTTEQVTAICGTVGPGSAEWLGEQVLRSAVTRTAGACAITIRALAENEALPPGRLISHALHALGPLHDPRARWRKANGDPEAAPEPAEGPDPPPSARVNAALYRSTPRHNPDTNPAPRPAPTATGRDPARTRP